MQMVDKNTFLASQTCLTKGWYLRTSDVQIPLTQSVQFLIDEGKQIGKMARSLYPQGILVNEGSNINNYEKTKQLINDNHIQVIFEATFIYNDYIVRADILKRIDGKWHLIEVKSSSASDDIKDELIDDLAYTTIILGLCGIELKKSGLLLVSKNYRVGMDNSDFFIEVDCTEKINKRRLDFIYSMDEISNLTSAQNKPISKFIYQCKKCDFFKDPCLGKNIDDPIFDLPRLSEKKFNALVKENIYQINQIPSQYNFTSSQKTVLTAVKYAKPFLNKEKLKELLGKIIYPVYYLDFESVSTTIPLYPNIGPYQEIVTQYSIHKLSAFNSKVEHFEFLAQYTNDDRRTLAEKLLIDVGKEGSVIVYHAEAEKRFINNLAKACPDLANELTSIIERIVDLEVIIRKTYYHPSFHGSYSIKVVLPVLVPEMSYKNLVVSDGQSASVVFAKLARGGYSAQEADVLCKALLKYCRQDTLAMVMIHSQLKLLCD